MSSSSDLKASNDETMNLNFVNKALATYPGRHLVFVYGTLKRGQPNYPVMIDKRNGLADFVFNGLTVDKYPLVIGSRYNIPYLIAKKGIGNQIVGEVYAVDNQMLRFLDDFEGHPTYYKRNQISIIADNGNGERAPIEAFKPWIYMLEKYKPEMLESSFYNCYDSFGTHGLRYIERCDRDDHPEAKNGLTEKVDVVLRQ